MNSCTNTVIRSDHIVRACNRCVGGQSLRFLAVGDGAWPGLAFVGHGLFFFDTLLY
jgi:hypothetical protein